MQAAALPSNEALRLSSLYDLDILDSQREGIFDEVTELAASLCNAPIALVSLIDESRQWFKARVGLEAAETARSVSFCSHAILQPGIFMVQDTLDDPRFFDNPLVTGPPHIRFYAGAPLFTAEGFGLGTLCVIDRVPRALTVEQQKALSVLRTHVLKLLELRRVSRDLATVNRELEAFSYTVSHDLRAPLRAVSGFAQILMSDHAAILSTDARSLVERISAAAHRMNQLTVDLIDFSRLSRQPLELVRVDLSRIAHDVTTVLRNTDPGRAVDVHIEPDMVAMGDPGMLRIVLENLIHNAWKFTARSEHPRIAFGSELVHGTREYLVRDNGVGFEMAYVDKLFQPFQRLHAHSDFPGTGIGLATVRRIVERHGGAVRAESELNRGTTIRFSLKPKRRLDVN